MGTPGGLGVPQRLPRLMPLGPAMEILLTGDRINAQQALQWGLVNRVVPRAELMDAALELAERIVANPPLGVRSTKEIVLRSLELPIGEGYDLARSWPAEPRHGGCKKRFGRCGGKAQAGVQGAIAASPTEGGPAKELVLEVLRCPMHSPDRGPRASFSLWRWRDVPCTRWNQGHRRRDQLRRTPPALPTWWTRGRRSSRSSAGWLETHLVAPGNTPFLQLNSYAFMALNRGKRRHQPSDISKPDGQGDPARAGRSCGRAGGKLPARRYGSSRARLRCAFCPQPWAHLRLAERIRAKGPYADKAGLTGWRRGFGCDWFRRDAETGRFANGIWIAGLRIAMLDGLRHHAALFAPRTHRARPAGRNLAVAGGNCMQYSQLTVVEDDPTPPRGQGLQAYSHRCADNVYLNIGVYFPTSSKPSYERSTSANLPTIPASPIPFTAVSWTRKSAR